MDKVTYLITQLFLMLRMAIYVGAFPIAAWLGGNLDPETGIVTFNVYDLLEYAEALSITGLTFLSGRYVKRKGGAT